MEVTTAAIMNGNWLAIPIAVMTVGREHDAGQRDLPNRHADAGVPLPGAGLPSTQV